MDIIRCRFDDFADNGERAQTIEEWRERYDGLVTILGRLGSEVFRRRALERDQDVPPQDFVRDAVHEFIFPPQESGVTSDRSATLDSTPGYGMRREHFGVGYDPALVRGHLRLTYDDVHDAIRLKVTDEREHSVLNDEVRTALAGIAAAIPQAEER